MRLLIVLVVIIVVLVLAEGCVKKDSKSDSKSKSKSKSSKSKSKSSKSVSHSKTKSISHPHWPQYEHPSKSKSGSYSASFSGPWGSFSNSWSWSISGRHRQRLHYFYTPACCDPCELLHDFESEYFQECGQFWKEEGDTFEAFYKKCTNIKCYSGKIKILHDVQESCYKDFGVVIQYKCPRVDLCTAIEGCDIKDNKIKTPSALVNYCSKKSGHYCPPRGCNECSGFADQSTMFYQYCGKHLDQALLKSLVTKCHESSGDDRKAIIWMLYGRCKCLPLKDGQYPDPCAEAASIIKLP